MDYEAITQRLRYSKAILTILSIVIICIQILEITTIFKQNHHNSDFQTMEKHLFPFRAPFRLIVAGPSGAGKTEFVKQLIDHAPLMIKPSPPKIVWYYAVAQPWFPSYSERIEFIEGLPDKQEISSRQNQLMILDDMSTYANKNTSQLFACDSHHRNISVVYITQNFFQKNGVQRDISLNATHIAFFKNPRDNTQIFHLSRQMYPDHTKFLTTAYKDATSLPYSYLLLDLTPDVDERFRVRSHIFPGQHLRVYQPKRE
jgi:adenylate kinase family enzyme